MCAFLCIVLVRLLSLKHEPPALVVQDKHRVGCEEAVCQGEIGVTDHDVAAAESVRRGADGGAFVLGMGHLALFVEIAHHLQLGEEDAVGREVAEGGGVSQVEQETVETLCCQGDLPVVGGEQGLIVGERGRGGAWTTAGHHLPGIVATTGGKEGDKQKKDGCHRSRKR